MGLIRTILRAGRAAERAPRAPRTELAPAGHEDSLQAPKDSAPALQDSAPALKGSVPALKGSVQVRHVDAGSCNGCEIEIGQAFSPVYDAERYGARLVASPRHADVLTVTGPVTWNMAGALCTTYEAMPEPRLVVSIGDCARTCGVFAGGHAVAGPVSDVVPVDLHVPGCPPEPSAIVAALRGLTGR